MDWARTGPKLESENRQRILSFGVTSPVEDGLFVKVNDILEKT